MLRQNRDFLQQFQVDLSCPASIAKIFYFRFSENHVSLSPSCFPWRGGSRSSRTLETGCGGREAVQRVLNAPTKAASRTAKVCGPDLPMLGSSSARRIAGRWWLSKPGHQGERAISRKAIAQGMPVVPALPVVTAACIFCCRRAMGAACTRHSLRPPFSRGP
jgi:hypothetical protein